MRLLTIVLCFTFYRCTTHHTDTESSVKEISTNKVVQQLGVIDSVTLSALEIQMQNANLINVKWLNSDIEVDLRYSTTDNFLQQDVYGNFDNAYLEESTAKKLALAQHHLDQLKLGLRLKIWDAARPVSLQQKMWDALDVPANQKGRFVSNPKNHSLHNYGCAVDVTLIDTSGIELDMGTAFDQFDSLAQPKYEQILLLSGALSNKQITNRERLRAAMTTAGFYTISSEWWHFNSCTRAYAKLNFRLLN